MGGRGMSHFEHDFDEKYKLSSPTPSIKKTVNQRIAVWKNVDCTAHARAFLPVLGWIKEYRRDDALTDLIAGITVGILSVPQAMAYASLANVNAIIGLYTSFFPTLVYVIFGTSKHITLGMFAVISLMVGNVVERELQGSTLNNTDTFDEIPSMGEAVILVSTLTFVVGIIMAVMAILQLHFITAYLSEPLVGGFTTGAACHVFASQMPKLIGVHIKSRHGIFGLFKLPYFLKDFVTSVPRANLVSTAISTLSIAVLMVGKYLVNPYVQPKIRFPVPFELFVIAIGTLVSHFLKLSKNYAVHIIGPIPLALPTPSIPEFSLVTVILLDALLIAIVIFSVTVSVGKVFGKKHNYHINPSQELKALSICQLVGGFMSCHPASGSLSRAAVNSQLSATSQISSAVSATLVFFVIIFVGPFLYHLPMAILASIIVVALQGMFLQFREIARLWKISKIDLFTWVVSFLGTSLWNVSEGIGIAIIFSILTVIFRTQWPKAVSLGQVDNTELYKDIRRYRTSNTNPHIAIYRYDAPLLFLNSESFKVKAVKLRNERFSGLPEYEKKYLIIDASGFTYMDYTGVEALKDLFNDLRKMQTTLFIASVKASARTLFERCSLYDAIPRNYFFPSIHDAVLFANNDLRTVSKRGDDLSVPGGDHVRNQIS